MYIYQSHLGGGFYATDEQKTYEECYCEACGDSDTQIGVYDENDVMSAMYFVMDVLNYGYAPEFIMQSVNSMFKIPTAVKTDLYKIINGLHAMYNAVLDSEELDAAEQEQAKQQGSIFDYTVHIVETLQHDVRVSAKTEDEALAQVRSMYANEEIVLDAGDYKTTDIFV